MKIQITVGEVSLTATLDDSETAQAIYDALPYDLPFNTWGDEIYFGIPLYLKTEGERELVEVGELAYWPPGHAFCIFYGPTPASTDDRPRAASEIIPFGRIDGDATAFNQAKAPKIQVIRLDE